jgi:hypothetical protein
MTKYAELFRALGAPFAPGEVKTKPGGNGLRLSYVTSRTVMIRLDEVLGPENWWDDFFPLENSVICRLTIRLPDGETVTKVDAGGFAGLADAGDDEKSGFADAFKRTAVKFGVGRYLYRDGVAKLTTATPEAPTDAPLVEHRPAPARETVTTGSQLAKFAETCKIDPCLKGFIVGRFIKRGFPARIQLWSQPQVAQALPEIKAHLEKLKAAKNGEAACSIVSRKPDISPIRTHLRVVNTCK